MECRINLPRELSLLFPFWWGRSYYHVGSFQCQPHQILWYSVSLQWLLAFFSRCFFRQSVCLLVSLDPCMSWDLMQRSVGHLKFLNNLYYSDLTRAGSLTTH
ncbi:hypothetical protein CC78DRAFT_363417 [Lojkania enalia]|uniref:Uncharacterized protein n=1 Tax=Lojkania enalia TaxID=147567 RepID=A0A9P4K6P9_9PLEO|nr:hypothetical protein CC78DRAFT_363417 [Didymosphaeria enalia]